MIEKERKPSWLSAEPAAQQASEKPARVKYQAVCAAVERRWRQRGPQKERMMQDVVDRLWDSFGKNPYSWCGFYLFSKDRSELIPGPQQGSPVSKGLGLESFCGKAAADKKTAIVENAPALGISLDGADAGAVSGIAVPVYVNEKPQGAKKAVTETAFGVFEATSSQPASFGETDRRWLEHLLRAFSQEPAQ
jgi:putative methionine-R-sulfoxide reductase with GAF domain